jgi:nuclear cap-binding protein subunit 1
MKKKAPEETIDVVINQIQDEAASHGVSDVLVPSTDAYMTCVCEMGFKSISHVLSSIERSKDRLLSVGPQSEAARIQIVDSVVDYWKDHPGNAVNIVGKLLNYSVLSPMCVIRWALAPERLGAGHILAVPHVYEMLKNTLNKVTTRVRQVGEARLKVWLPAEQIDLLNNTLVNERAELREMFRVIDDATGGIASGSADALIAMTDQEEIELLKMWGARWRRVFARKSAVEEAVVGEAAMEGRIRVAVEKMEKEKIEKENDEAAAAAATTSTQDGEGVGNGASDTMEADIIE